MKRAKVSELKAHLSERLAEVRRGASLIVCDRSVPIAMLVPYEHDAGGFLVDEPAEPGLRVAQLRGVKLKRKTDVLRLLREDRDGR